MTAKPPRRGRLDNGLEAADYAVAADVDPRVGEHLLDVLALADIAAYLQPTTDLDPVTRSSVLPARPTDRLYVDRAHLGDAQEYARRLEAGYDPLSDEVVEDGAEPDDFEVRWRDLVSQLEDQPTDRTGAGDKAGPDGADHDPEPDSDRERDGTTGGLKLPRLRSALPTAGQDEPSLLDALDTEVYGDDERFVPPEPPPVPPISRPAAISLTIIGAGLLVLVWPRILTYFNIRSEQAPMVVATIFLVIGSIGLVLRLRPAPDEDSDPDDGAQV